MKSRAAVAFAAGEPLKIVEIDVAPPRSGEVLASDGDVVDRNDDDDAKPIRGIRSIKGDEIKAMPTSSFRFSRRKNLENKFSFSDSITLHEFCNRMFKYS